MDTDSGTTSPSSEATLSPAFSASSGPSMSGDESAYSLTAHPPSMSANSTTPDGRSIIALLLSLRVALLSHLSDVESRIAAYDGPSLPKLFSYTITSASTDNNPQPRRTSISHSRKHSECEPLRDVAALLESIRADVARHLPNIDIDWDFDLPSISDIDIPSLPALANSIEASGQSIIAALRAHSPAMPSLPDDFIPDLKKRLHALSELADPPARLQQLLNYFEKMPLIMDEFEPSSDEDRRSSKRERQYEREAGRESKKASAESGISSSESSGMEGDGDEDAPLIVGGSRTTRAEVRRGLAKSLNGDRLVRYEDLPFKWRNNEFIHTGYRFIPFSRWHLLLKSMFQWHNETINILSHLLPTLIFPLISLVPLPVLPLPTYFWPSWLSLPEVTIDALPHWYFWSAAACCLACSVIWHTVTGCSDLHVCEWGARVDYVGIGWLISASITSTIYYGFYCDPHTAALYAAFSVLTGALGTVLPFQHWFNQRRNKKWRIAFFVACALSALIFLAHLSVIRGVWRTAEFYAPIVPSVAAYTFGLCFYAWHFPECAFPGKFDYIGASHQIWHLSIVAAIWLHYRAIASFHLGAMEYACAANY